MNLNEFAYQLKEKGLNYFQIGFVLKAVSELSLGYKQQRSVKSLHTLDESGRRATISPSSKGMNLSGTYSLLAKTSS